ncbi:MAG: metallophosphoesterase family protein [Planctomycetota bacterium]
MIYFTADTHFGHENIIRYCTRPFESAEHMDRELMHYWNCRVEPDDTVYHLGDFTLANEHQARDYFHQLNGRIFILGNAWHHDSRWLPVVEQVGTSGKQAKMGLAPFYSASHHQVTILPAMHILEFPEYGSGGHSQALVLCHYPLAVWDRRHYGSWHLHGHSHGTHQNGGLSFDVGVDCNQYRPVSMEGVIRQMKVCGWIDPK